MTQVNREKPLRLGEYVGYALGDTASGFFFWTFNFFLTYYYVDVWGLSATAVIALLPVVRVIDAVTDPLMGAIADRTVTRWGKFRPYLLWMAVPYGVCGYLIFANPAFLGESGKLAYAYVTYTLMALAYTAVNVPYSALLGVISPSPATRAVASSFRFAGANAGGLLITLLVRPLVDTLGKGDPLSGFERTMAIFAVASVLLFFWSFATTRERVQPPPHQKSNLKEELREVVTSRPWLVLLVATLLSTSFIGLRNGSALFYLKYCSGDDGAPLATLLGLPLDRSTLFISSGMACQVLGNVALATVARRIDKRQAAAALTGVTAVAFAAFYVLPTDNFPLLLVVNAIGMLCMGPTSALMWAMYGDVADYGEWKFGRRSTGLVYAASLFSLKSGLAVAGSLLGFFLAAFGYVKDAAQTERAQLGILLAFSLVPGVFAAGKAAALLLFPLSNRDLAQIQRDLSARAEGA